MESLTGVVEYGNNFTGIPKRRLGKLQQFGNIYPSDVRKVSRDSCCDTRTCCCKVSGSCSSESVRTILGWPQEPVVSLLRKSLGILETPDLCGTVTQTSLRFYPSQCDSSGDGIPWNVGRLSGRLSGIFTSHYVTFGKTTSFLNCGTYKRRLTVDFVVGVKRSQLCKLFLILKS